MPEDAGGRALEGMATTGRLLTAAEIGERLGYTERYVWRLGREGVLPRIKVPGRKDVRFAEEDVERFVREGREPARPVARVVPVSADRLLPLPVAEGAVVLWYELRSASCRASSPGVSLEEQRRERLSRGA